MSNSVRPHRRQPTRLPCPWDSPGKNTAVGCHFLLQCMKVKSESEVAQSCPTLHDPMDCSLPGSSIHGIFQARVLEWGAIAFSETLPQGEANSWFGLRVSGHRCPHPRPHYQKPSSPQPPRVRTRFVAADVSFFPQQSWAQELLSWDRSRFHRTVPPVTESSPSHSQTCPESP